MEFITFKQFIYTINVRQYTEEYNSEEDRHDSQVIRLYWKDKVDNWIDIGWYDFDRKGMVWDRLSLFLNDRILNSVVVCIKPDIEMNELKVYLEDKKDFLDLDDYAN